MLYSLFTNLVDSYPVFNVFRYLTVRTGLSMFTSMIIVFFIGNPIINYFASNKIHNPIRSDGPMEHIVKKIGTPTMGGILILIGIFSGVLLWSDLSNPYNWFLIFIVGGLGALGAYDDYKKIKSGSSGGVSFKFKIISQIIIALIGIYILTYYVNSAEERRRNNLEESLRIDKPDMTDIPQYDNFKWETPLDYCGSLKCILNPHSTFYWHPSLTADEYMRYQEYKMLQYLENADPLDENDYPEDDFDYGEYPED